MPAVSVVSSCIEKTDIQTGRHTHTHLYIYIYIYTFILYIADPFERYDRVPVCTLLWRVTDCYTTKRINLPSLYYSDLKYRAPKLQQRRARLISRYKGQIALYI